MATAEELLSTLATDNENRILIDLETRIIPMPSGVVYGVTNDKDVKDIKFKMEKAFNGIDLSEYKIRINYINANGSGDVYEVNPKIEDEMIVFNWLLGRNVFAYKGAVRFIICIKNISSDGVVLNELNTTMASFNIAEGLETEPVILNENPEVIENILLRLGELEENGGGSAEPGSPGKDGRGIVSIKKTATVGLVDTYTISYTDATTSEIKVTNGKAGEKGDSGKSAYELAVEKGFSGTADEWLLAINGSDGKSAYELAVEKGYTGSESEWLDSLNGKDGKDMTRSPIVSSVEESLELQPNILYKMGTMANLNITLATPADTTVVNEYMLSFDSGTTATTFTYPSDIIWSTGTPTIEASKHYEVSILDGYGLIVGF